MNAASSLLLLLATAGVAWAEHDPGFCTLSQNNEISLPISPSVYSMSMSMRNDQNELMSAYEYYNGELDKTSFMGYTSKGRFRAIFDWTTKQIQVINMTDMANLLGLYCRNLNSQGRKPQTLPDRFSMRIERIGQGSEETTYLKEAYDFNANMSLLLGYPPATSGDSGKYGAGKLLYIHDFRSGISYIRNEDMVTKSIPMSAVITSQATWLSSSMYIYDFEQQEIVFNRHDITACFSRDAKQHFQLYFSLPDNSVVKYVRDNPNGFISLLVPLTALGLNVSPLRVLDPEVSVNGMQAILELTVTDRPSFLTDADETPLNEIEAAFNILINKKDIFTLLRVEGRDYTIYADSVTTVEERTNNLKSIGYSAGALIGICFAMEIIGLALGILVVFGIYKFRGGTLLGVDPFRPQRILERLLTGEVGTGEIVEAPDAAAAVGTVGGISVGDPLLADVSRFRCWPMQKAVGLVGRISSVTRLSYSAMYGATVCQTFSLRSSAVAATMGAVVFNGRKNSMAWQAARSSMASTCSTCSTTRRLLRAEKPPMLTWSSCPALVDSESTLDGWHSTLFSEAVVASFTNRIISRAVKLGKNDVVRKLYGILGNSVHLRAAAQCIGVLHFVAESVRGGNLRFEHVVAQQSAKSSSHFHLAGVTADGVNVRIECSTRAFKHFK
uniref:Protein kinase domain-containing protein n=1 Tax=Macrostomum lignano TaxID=282301 RepID=A0A1I8HW04_9PLAT